LLGKVLVKCGMAEEEEAQALLQAVKETDEEDEDGPGLRAAADGDGVRGHGRRQQRGQQQGQQPQLPPPQQQQRSLCYRTLLGTRRRVLITVGLSLPWSLLLLYWAVCCGKELALLGALCLRGQSIYHPLDMADVDMDDGLRVSSLLRDGAEPAASSAPRGGGGGGDNGNASSVLAPTELVPRLIHRMWKSDDPATLPAGWNSGYQSCVNSHPEGWQLRLWSDQALRDFIAAEYAWFLPEYDSYPRPIERVDAARYFVLYHYGGVYLDLDVGCARSLEPLRAAVSVPGKGAMFPATEPCGVSNDVIFSAPRCASARA
jgi:hypothetical protein